jgi:ribonuclease VapC
MIIDTSAVIAIIAGEPERGAFLNAVVQASPPRMSAASLLEASILVDGRKDPILSRRFDDFIASAGIEVVDVTRTQVDIARGAFRTSAREAGTQPGSISATASPMPWPASQARRCSSRATTSLTPTSRRRPKRYCAPRVTVKLRPRS